MIAHCFYFDPESFVYVEISTFKDSRMSQLRFENSSKKSDGAHNTELWREKLCSQHERKMNAQKMIKQTIKFLEFLQ